jgi:hypothetical protein
LMKMKGVVRGFLPLTMAEELCVSTSRRSFVVLGNLCVWVGWCGHPNLNRG